MNDHKRCPECDALDTEVVFTDWYNDMVERTRVCNECPTQWVVSYGKPIVRDVEQYD